MPRRARPVSVIVALAALCALPAFSQQQFRISGVVVDSGSGAPIDRAEISAAPVSDLQATVTTLSRSDGSFTFTDLAPGKYRLMAGRVGYTNQGLDQHEGFMTAVAVGPHLDSGHIRCRLSRESVISGAVTDELGDPVRNADVFLFQRRLADGLRSPQLAGRATANDLGEYRFPHLPPGTYMVVVYAKPWYSNGATPFRQESNASSQRVTRSVTGSVVDSVDTAHDSVSSAIARDPIESLSFVSSLQPAPNPGLDVVYPLSYYSNADSFDSATPLVLSPGSAFVADFSIHPVPALRLLVKPASSGTSRDPRELYSSPAVMTEVAGTQLEIFSADPSAQSPGFFEISGVPPGEIHILTNTLTELGPAWHADSKRVSTNGVVDLSNLPSASVSGTADPLECTPPGSPVSGKLNQCRLALVSPDGKSVYLAPIAPKGDFALVVPSGKYSVELQPTQFFHVTSIQATGAPLSGHVIDLLPGANAKLLIQGAKADCTVTGTALKNGNPFAGAMLLLVPEDSSQNPSLFHRDQSDSDGTFTMSPVLPGRYTLVAIENGWDLEWSSLPVLFPYLANGVPVTLKPASSTSVSVKVQ